MGRPPLPPDQRKPKLSGAQRRKLKHQQREEEDLARERQAPAGVVAADEAWADEFREAGDIDLENPDTDLAYVRKVQLIVFRQMATTANPSKAQQDCWRRIKDMSAVVGMTSNRAKLEADVRALKAALKKYEDHGSALVLGPGAGIPKSPGARGQRRGPRPVPDGPTEPEKH